ncbi:MAG: transcription-repair coupling factor [Bacteroidales bacterium]|nr:transcription-repair coupling factor [Bacteroidales bacterium]
MFSNPYIPHPYTAGIIRSLEDKGNKVFHLKGLSGSSRAALFQAVVSEAKGNHLVLFHDKEEAAYFYTDLVNLEGTPERTLFFPSSYKRSVQYGQTDEANIITRTQTLKRLNEQRVSSFIITYAEALLERVMTRAELGRHTLEIKTGESLGMEFLEEVLNTYHFQLVDFVYEPGQYAIRGGIADVFSYASSQPCRIDFFGDEVDSIRLFDVETQRSQEQMKRISIIPNVQWEQEMGDKRVSFLEFIPSNTTIWLDDLELVLDHIRDIWEKTTIGAEGRPTGIPQKSGAEERREKKERGLDRGGQSAMPPSQDDSVYSERTADGSHPGLKEAFLVREDLIREKLEDHARIEFTRPVLPAPAQEWKFSTTPQPPFNKDFGLLARILHENNRNGLHNYILSESSSQLERLRAIFDEVHPGLAYTEGTTTVHEGFTDHDLRVAIYTDHQIFDRYHKFRLHDRFTKKEALSVKELSGLMPGDYVVHVDHGIGKFGGLERIDVNGRRQEAVRLVYKDNDVLFVNIHSLHKISKYKGKEGHAPRVYKLGTGAWQKLKQKTKSKVKDIATELIALYARRREQKGFAFSPDTYLQRELEASFIYEDTPDQEKATRDFKSGMEAEFPMDRLICGDVGFGKTEVAIRAAFKALSDSKQVAVLVPTTVLAFQHYNTFKNRLKDFPCTVDYISRFRTAGEQTNIVKRLKEGSLDILIGTHKLVSQQVKFRDLGLLIIDEEQKFGVSVKEKLKQIKLNVDTLTLTATPIPRTLQFSLMGARDLSIINTPPPNRHPIITELHPFNEEIIREAIEYEVSRGGQVFFIHNRVQNIVEVKQMVDALVPGIRSVIAHGQMEGKQLEKVMLDFMAGDHDVLIATSIIESGLDIPNTNTIIINNAHHFGLSDLHQLRGRVGRSNKKAFCYLFAPHVTLLTQEARRRLKAIEEHSGLGSGFNIAMQDLDIRGAGNLLGAEQSGFIADIGFETYHKILNEAIQELKEGIFSDLFEKETVEKAGPNQHYAQDCQIDTDLELLLPESYIANISERMHLYRELDSIETSEALEQFRKMLRDRFGELPSEAEELLNVVRLRWLAMQTGVEKIILKKSTLIAYFVSDPDALFYRSQVFEKIIGNIQRNPRLFSMRQDKDRLSFRMENTGSIDATFRILEHLQDGE